MCAQVVLEAAPKHAVQIDRTTFPLRRAARDDDSDFACA
jgi:hypothetical protein